MRKTTTCVLLSLLVLATFAGLFSICAAKAEDSEIELLDDFQLIFAPKPLDASAFCNVTVMKGQTWYFFAQSVGGDGAHTYQWYEGTSMLAGQTSMLLAMSKATAGTYTYTCVVTDEAGTTVTTNSVTLTVI